MPESIDPTGYGIEEGKAACLAGAYERFFSLLVNKRISLLELGVWEGASLRFWRDYFENATIVGLDRNPPFQINDPQGMIHVYQGYQQDTNLLDRIVYEQAPDGFDVIIDDCAHIGMFARISFWHLFQNHLKPGGLYCIEDWGTGYFPWRKCPDAGYYKAKSQLISNKDRLFIRLVMWLSDAFPSLPSLVAITFRLFNRSKIRSHERGMVGFIKELVDAYALGTIAIPRSGSGRYLLYGISQLHITQGVIYIFKSAEPPPNSPADSISA